MENIVRRKLEQLEEVTWTDQEVTWLIDHVGDVDPGVRDELVYNAISLSLIQGKFTLDQYHQLVSSSINGDMINSQTPQGIPSTLQRSFTALMNACLIAVDDEVESKYCQQLTTEEKEYFFNQASLYLRTERNQTGYSKK